MESHIVWHAGAVARRERLGLTGGPGATVWLTGLSGSGKSTIGHALEIELIASGRAAYVLDGDNLRFGLNSDLGFSAADRAENVRRVSHVAALMADSGMVAVVPIISPYAAGRARARAIHDEWNLPFVEVFVDTPLEVCESRDPKGLYRKARAGEIPNMTGIDDPYEPPEEPDLIVRTVDESTGEAVERIVKVLGSVSGHP